MQNSSVVVKDLRLKDKDKDLMSKDEDKESSFKDKDLMSKDEDLSFKDKDKDLGQHYNTHISCRHRARSH